MPYALCLMPYALCPMSCLGARSPPSSRNLRICSHHLRDADAKRSCWTTSCVYADHIGARDLDDPGPGLLGSWCFPKNSQVTESVFWGTQRKGGWDLRVAGRASWNPEPSALNPPPRYVILEATLQPYVWTYLNDWATWQCRSTKWVNKGSR